MMSQLPSQLFGILMLNPFYKLLGKLHFIKNCTYLVKQLSFSFSFKNKCIIIKKFKQILNVGFND